MVHVAEACAECTQNCLLMHKKDKNPSPVATTFFKVMLGDDYSKVMFLPPKFARSVRNKAGKTSWLEDSSGEKWTVKFTLIDRLLAFEEGWNAFSTAHGLKEGDLLVFHYIMESHFVVLMYGQSGCPEIQHFGFNRPQKKDSRKKQRLITDNSKPSNVNTDHHHLSESSESERSDYEHLEIRQSVRTQHKDERNKKKGTFVQVPPSVNAKNTCKQPQMKDTRKKQKMITANSKPSNGNNTDDHHYLSESSESERSDYGHLQIRQSVGAQQRKAERMKKKETVVQVPPSVNAKNTCNRPQMKDTRKKQRLITDNSKPSNVNTDDHHFSESSESERCDNEHLELRQSVGTQHKAERIKKKGTVGEVSPSVNGKNTYNNLFASSSRAGPSVSGKKLVRDENHENMVSKTPPTVKKFCLVDNDIILVEDDLSILEITPAKSEDRRKNNVAVGSGGNEIQVTKSGKILETPSEESKENPKKRTIMPSEAICNNSVQKRLRGLDLPIARPKMAKKEPAGASKTNTPGSKLHDAVHPSPSTGIFPKSIPELMKVTKKELTSNNGSDEFDMKDTKKVLLHNSLAEEDNNSFVKVEPVDYDEALPRGPTNSLFSAVMNSYQYLELPEWVKLKKVILLRNGGDLWPVLFQNQFGTKALTQSWEAFARERGIQPGDICEFVLESEPNPDLPFSVFKVQVTAK